MATHFQRYPNVGALTGELTVQRPYRTFLTAVQFCEWKVSHLMQKPVESICGFLTVLPGAFCAFRWAAVEVRPLACPPTVNGNQAQVLHICVPSQTVLQPLSMLKHARHATQLYCFD